MYSNISQVLLLYKMWNYNKFVSTKSLGYVTDVSKFHNGYMEHGLEHITFYVNKHIAALVRYYNPGLIRNKPLGCLHLWNWSIHWDCFTGTGAISIGLPQCQRNSPEGYGKTECNQITTKHKKVQTMRINVGVYCIWTWDGTGFCEIGEVCIILCKFLKVFRS